jgi:hypothetical protein
MSFTKSKIHRDMSFTKSKQTAASATQMITSASRMVITKPSQKDKEGYLFRHHSKRRNRPIVTLTVSHPGPSALPSAAESARACRCR